MIMATKKRKRKGVNGVVSETVQRGSTLATSNPTAVKITIGVLSAGIVFIIGKKIYNSIQQAKMERLGQKAVDDYPVNWENVTFPHKEKDAAIIAQALLAAMDRYMTDKETIDKYLGENGIIKTADDFAAVYQAFGTVGYNQFTGRRNDKHDKLNLTGWLRGELSGKRMQNIENKLRNDWGFLGGL